MSDDLKDVEHTEEYIIKAFPRIEVGYKLGSIDSRLGTLENDGKHLSAKIDLLGDKLAAHDLHLSRLDAKIDAVEARLGDRIDAVEARLGDRIDAVEARFGDRIDTVEARLGDRIDAVEARLGGRIDALEAGLNEVKSSVDKLQVAVGKLQIDVGKLHTNNNIILALLVAIAAGFFLQFFSK